MIFSKVKIAIAVIFSLLLFNNVRLAKKVNDLDKQVGIAMNNAQVWENIANQNRNEARLLELTVNDFKNSNDSLIKVARDQQKKLKIKDKQLRQVASTETVIRDTTVRIIPSKEKDFCVELKPNQLTTITVARKDSVFTHTMEILNHQDLFVYGSTSPDPATFTLIGTVTLNRSTVEDAEFKDSKIEKNLDNSGFQNNLPY